MNNNQSTMQENPFHLFELEETDSMETKHRIELLCLQLIRFGEVEYDSPDMKTKVVVDGVLRVGKIQKKIRLNSNSLIKCLLILKTSHELLISNSTATIRELYYRNKSKNTNQKEMEVTFSNESQCERIILLCCQLLGVTRTSLGLISSGKGFVVGLEGFSSLSQLNPIPHFRTWDELEPILNSITNRPRSIPPPKFILVIEKHTILHRLIQTNFCENFPCIAITGRGFPDLQTRRLVYILHTVLNLPVFGLCDMNPHGFALMSTFAFGSIRFAGEAFRYAIPNLKILGMYLEDGIVYENLCKEAGVSPAFKIFTKQDLRCVQSLITNPVIQSNSNLFTSIVELKESSKKLDLDDFESVFPGFLFNVWLPTKIQKELENSNNHNPVLYV